MSIDSMNLVKNTTYKKSLIFSLVIITAVLFTFQASAGTDGTEFDSIWDTLVGWSQGTLGRVITIALVIVGIVAGITRQSVMAFAIGVGCGVGLYNAPTIIQSIVTAALTNSVTVTSFAVNNGLL